VTRPQLNATRRKRVHVIPRLSKRDHLQKKSAPRSAQLLVNAVSFIHVCIKTASADDDGRALSTCDLADPEGMTHKRIQIG